MKKWALWIAVAAALFGGTLAAISTSQHMRIARDGLQEASFCAINETVNCDVVNASSYSEFLGVPIAWWGLCFYISILVLSLIAIFSKGDRRGSVAAAWCMACGGIAYSAFLAYIAFFVLDVFCIECTGMYLANTTLFIVLYVGMGIPVGRVFGFIRDYALAVFKRPSNLAFRPMIFRQAFVVGFVFLLGWISMSLIAPGDASGMSVDERIRAFYMQSLHDIDVDPSWAVWGNPDAKVTLIEFSEYQCPFCRLAAFNVKPYLREFKDGMRYFFVNYPLDSNCNDQVKRQMHPIACFAAKAAICADMRGDFWSFHDDLFRLQGDLDRESILDLTSSRGWDRDEFLDCINSDQVSERLRREVLEGQKIYITGTPSLYLGGRKLRYWRDPKYVQALVKEEIKKAGRASRAK